jgi:hypothetical protein
MDEVRVRVERFVITPTRVGRDMLRDMLRRRCYAGLLELEVGLQ